MNDDLWDDTVTIERAKIFAQHNPQPPMKGWQVAAVAVLFTCGCILAYAAFVSVL